MTQFINFEDFFKKENIADLRNLYFPLAYKCKMLLEYAVNFKDTEEAIWINSNMIIETLEYLRTLEECKDLDAVYLATEMGSEDFGWFIEELKEFTSIIEWIEDNIAFKKTENILETIKEFVKQSEEEPTLIKESYVEEYAEEYARNCGYCDSINPLNDCINWEAWADKVRIDYTEVDNPYQDQSYNQWLRRSY